MLFVPPGRSNMLYFQTHYVQFSSVCVCLLRIIFFLRSLYSKFSPASYLGVAINAGSSTQDRSCKIGTATAAKRCATRTAQASNYMIVVT